MGDPDNVDARGRKWFTDEEEAIAHAKSLGFKHHATIQPSGTNYQYSAHYYRHPETGKQVNIYGVVSGGVNGKQWAVTKPYDPPKK